MSFSINLKVENGTAVIVSQSGALADGAYVLGGHVASPDSPVPSISVGTPFGGLSGYLLTVNPVAAA